MLDLQGLKFLYKGRKKRLSDGGKGSCRNVGTFCF